MRKSFIILLLAIILAGGISVVFYFNNLQKNMTYIIADMGECNDREHNERGEFVIPIIDVAIPVDNPEEVYRIAKQTIQYCDLSVSLDKESIRKWESYPDIWLVEYFGNERGELWIDKNDGNVSKRGMLTIQ